MRVPLIERLDPSEPALAAYDATAGVVDARRSLRPRRKETIKGLERRMRRYFDWCRGDHTENCRGGDETQACSTHRRQQEDPEFVKAETALAYTLWMTGVKRYAPSTIWLALQALQNYAEAAGVNVSMQLALAEHDRYRRGIAPQVRRRSR